MSESAAQDAESNTPKVSASKDKKCPYCGQAFTSSSLGRHLDLYIKEKNPKPADGLHDVEAIKKLRGNITRRQARGSLGGRREDSSSVGTPRQSVRRDSSVQESTEGYRSSTIPKDGQYAVDSTLSKFPFAPRWEATGVINDIPNKNTWESSSAPDGNKRPGMQRNVSKQVAHKAQFDVKQKLADAMDTARAAELALRELVGSWRAAKQQINSSSMPFDFDPLSLDFPALTLQCLQPPPTLFSSTQHPTSTSWSVQSPSQREFGALQAYFQEEFRVWKIACASATTAAVEEIVYPPSSGLFRDAREAVRKAEKSADTLEKHVNEHLQSAYTAWESLQPQRRNELWVLELARGVGRKNKDLDKIKEQQHLLKQENANLKLQIDQLNRLQQPREFKMLSPTTIPLDKDVIAYAYEQGVKGAKGVGFDLDDRHLDLSAVVSKSIERWKNVITSTRVTSGGMVAQRSLDQGNQNAPAASVPSPSQSQQSSSAQTPQLAHRQPQSQPQQHVKRLSTASTNCANSEQTTSSATNTGPPSVDEVSDQDADAEMEDDDSFAVSPVKTAHPPMQQQATLEVPRTRGPAQARAAADMRFMMQNGTGSPIGRSTMAMSRSMPNINMAAMQGNPMQDADMGMYMG